MSWKIKITNTENRNYRLVELLRIFNHLFMHVPRVIAIRAGDTELLYFLKLVYSENSKSISAMGTRFFAEAR